MADEEKSLDPIVEPVRESKTLIRWVGVFAGSLLLIIVYFLNKSDGGFLILLEETSVARGLITFLVALVTLCIAFLIAIWVVASFAKPDDLKARFGYLKDVLATLVGILGTILGFYFGSADKSTGPPLAVSDVQIKSGQVVVHVSGGTPPYRYSLTPSSKSDTFPKISKDGWIFETLPNATTADSTVVMEVIDAKDKREVKTAKYLLPSTPAVAPPAR
jgi:hypothetical protein